MREIGKDRLEVMGRISDKYGIVFSEREALKRLRDADGLFFTVPGIRIDGREIEEFLLKLIAAEKEAGYSPVREKDYKDWDLSQREEADRALRREIIVNKEMSPHMARASLKHISENVIDAEDDPRKGEPFILIKRVPEEKLERLRGKTDYESLEKRHGRAYARTMLDVVNKFNATGMAENAMRRVGIDMSRPRAERELMLQQLVFEDIFEHWAGYEENTGKILSIWLGDDESRYDNYISPRDFKELSDNLPSEYRDLLRHNYHQVPLWMVLEARTGIGDMRGRIDRIFSKHRPAIEKYQSEQWYYVHNNSAPEKILFYKDGRAGLTDHSMAGLTHNKLLALVYDLGNMMSAAWMNTDFIKGIEEEVRAEFKDDPAAAEAVIKPGKLRSFADSLADWEKDWKEAGEHGMSKEQYLTKRNRLVEELKDALTI